MCNLKFLTALLIISCKCIVYVVINVVVQLELTVTE